MSYRRKHIKNKIHKIKPGKSIFKRPVFWYAVLFLILVCAGFYFFVFFDKFQVKNIIISGNEKTSSEKIENVVHDSINKKIISFFNWNVLSRSIFWVNKEKLNKEILEQFPIIGKIRIDKNLPHTLILGITERKPIGVFCNIDAGEQQQCFLIDVNGIIFEPLAVAPEDFLIVRQISEQSQVLVGEDVIGKNIMDFILRIKKNLKDNFQIDIKEALVTSPLRMDVKTSENWQIYFNLDPDSDINLQITKLNLLLSGQISPEARNSLQYIDLRFDRAYYK